MANTLVFDIGKTHVKLCVVSPGLATLAARETKNRVISQGLYPHADTDGIWQWFCEQALELNELYPIDSLNITTHGATAACVDTRTGRLALPVLDYEFTGLTDEPHIEEHYQQTRDPFALTHSPSLPAGLNLGRQLHWLAKQFPQEFERADALLMYPQYWFWRLTGECCSEVTSLGCHTDLWQPQARTFAPMVKRLGWAAKLPPVKSAQHFAQPLAEVCQSAGLKPECKVFAGIHDSNASYWRHKAGAGGAPFTVISTGTWSIVMSAATPPDSLIESHDMLANVDVNGTPVACARFMGGREYEAICKLTHAPLAQNSEPEEVDQRMQQLLASNTLALPAFAEAGGPFTQHRGRIQGELAAGSGNCLASLYCALMLDYQLDALQSQGDIIIEGAFLKNTLLCKLLAQLRAPQPILLSEDDTGTVTGCAMLARDNQLPNSALIRCEPATFSNLKSYKNLWRLSVQKLQRPTPEPT
ncbi:L-fuculose kinase [Simiduia sp. 21SJ11W-1]|uniref:FGGY-family carbohydrate kinase n=1 Tax=Simiduia sp. 21SJ11W-1 TaxID=2909669 RepID=UPI00209F76B0|nr:FGGY family carbohydrate kinase [Simiduia sp. 21SJ11W-1]UTA48351.1 L-fuculose kinase [Simiduia sp. 21SJ11W-1]